MDHCAEGLGENVGTLGTYIYNISWYILYYAQFRYRMFLDTHTHTHSGIIYDWKLCHVIPSAAIRYIYIHIGKSYIYNERTNIAIF